MINIDRRQLRDYLHVAMALVHAVKSVGIVPANLQVCHKIKLKRKDDNKSKRTTYMYIV